MNDMLRRQIALPALLGSLFLVAIQPGHSLADPDVYEIGVDPRPGFNLISWFNFGNQGVSIWENAVQEIYDAGFREVSISPVRFTQTNSSASQSVGSILPTSGKGPELSHLAAGIVRAKTLGMRVTVNPFVEMLNGSSFFSNANNPNSWRGLYDPLPGSAEWTTFWDDYQEYLVDVAQVAEASGAEAMNVGTELRAIVRNGGNNSKWNSVIGAVEAQFSGQLGYAANWDNFENNNLASTIWEHPAIDILGIDAYFENLLTNSQADASGTNPNPTFIDQVETAWNNLLDNTILPFAAQRKLGIGMPVEFAEVGYLPYNRTTVTPQNEGGLIDTDEQIMAFDGLLRALDGRADELLAMHIWQWAMPGSDGSKWNIDPTLPANQPNNVPVAQWLSDFVQNAVSPFTADFDIDGTVDDADLVIWESLFGTGAGADADGDGDSDGKDFLIWQRQFGSGFSTDQASPLASAHATVPEPSTMLLIFLALVTQSTRRKSHG